MSNFEFQGKALKIVEDRVDDLVDGCKRCVFYNDDTACAEVDAAGTGRVRCVDGDHHYEEVPESQPS